MKRVWFFDDEKVLGWRHVSRHVHQPRKHRANPVMDNEAPWEKDAWGWAWPSVLYDDEDGLFKAWYEMIPRGKTFGCYATSKDGVHWERPELGLCAFKGSRRNNIFYRGVIRWPHAICPNVIKRAPGDWHMYYWDALRPSGPRGVIYFTGKDGIRWQRSRTNPVVQTPVDRTRSGGVEDVLRVSYDPVDGRFLLSQRTLPLENLEKPLLQKEVPGGLTQRRVSIATSRDGWKFTPMRTVLTPTLNDPPDLQLYGLSPFRYEDFFLGYLLCYRTDKPNMDVELAYSPDAERWVRVAPNVRYIPTGPLGSPDCGLIHCAPAPVRVGDKLYIYYLGTNSDHSGGTVDKKPPRSVLCLAVAEAGRMVSARAGAKQGTILLGPLRVGGSRWTFDADARKGEIRMALRHPETFAEIKGFETESCDATRSDSGEHVAGWRGKSDISGLRSRNVLVQVTMQNADLFSLRA